MTDVISGNVLPVGFYHLDLHQRMPSHPDAINASPSSFTGLFGKPTVEEAARFLVLVAQQYGQWCGLTWAALLLLVYQDATKKGEQALRKLSNEQADKRHAWQLFWYNLAVFFTAGIYCLLYRRPRSEAVPVEQSESLFGEMLTLTHPDQLTEAFHELIRDKMVYSSPRDGETILFPTARLVSHILQGGERTRVQRWERHFDEVKG